MAGDIQLTVDLEAGDVTQAASQLEAEIRRIFESGAGDTLGPKFLQLQQKMDKAIISARDYRQQMASLATTQVPTQEFVEVDTQIKKSQSDLDKLIERMDKFKALGGKTSSSTFKAMQYDAEQLQNTIKYAKGELQDLINSGKATTTGINTEQYQVATNKLAQLNNQMRTYVAQANRMKADAGGPTTSSISKWGRLKENVKRATTAIRGFLGKARGLASNFLGLSRIFPKMNGGLGNFTGGLKKGFWTVMKYAFGLRSLFIVTNKIRSALKDGLKNLVQYSGTFNKSVSNMLSSLTYLKNSLATAFEPLITTVSPIIVNFIDTIANAISKVSQLFSALIGRDYYYKAKKVYQDYAASLQKDSDKTKEKVEKLQRTISGFDDVEILKEPDKKDDSSSGDTGYQAPTPADMFEKAAVTKHFKDIADMIKEAWEKADFTELGGIVGKKVKNALDNIPWEDIKKGAEKVGKSVATFINGFVETPGLWQTVGKTVAEGLNTGLSFADSFLKNIHSDSIGKGITTAISSFFKNVDWSLMGSTVSHAFARLADFVTGLISGIDWRNLPKNVAKAIKDFFTGFDWEDLSHSIGRLVGTAVKAAIDLALGVVDLLKELANWIGGSIKNRIDDLKEQGKPLGVAIIEGFFLGIWDILKSIGTWIYEHIIKPFIKGFKEGFGIASPSKVMAEQGGYVIEGLLKGILNALIAIGKWIKDNIIDPIIDGIKAGFSKFLEVGGLIVDKIKEGITKVKDGLLTIGGNIKDWIKDKIDVASFLEKGKDIAGKVKEGIGKIKDGLQTVGGNIVSWVKDNISVSDFLAKGKDIANKVKEGIGKIKDGLETVGGNIVSWVKNNISVSDFLEKGKDIADKVKEGIGKLKDKLEDAGSNIRSWLKDKIKSSSFKDTGENIAKKVKDGINNIKSKLQDAGSNIKSWINNKVSTGTFKDKGKAVASAVIKGVAALKKNLLGVGDYIVDKLKKGLAFGQTFINIGKNIVNGIIAGMKTIVDNSKKAIKSVGEKITTGFKDFFHIKSPSRLMRDEIGKMLILGLANGISDNASVAVAEMENVANKLMSATPDSLQLPDITAGKVVPYEVEAVADKSIGNVLGSLKNLIEMLEYSQDSQITSGDLESLMIRIIREYLNFSFYIGDEQVARHANKGNQLLNQRYNPVLT